MRKPAPLRAVCVQVVWCGVVCVRQGSVFWTVFWDEEAGGAVFFCIGVCTVHT
jgi:hypothetical protein